MQKSDFLNALKMFSDPNSDFLHDGNNLIFSVNGDAIQLIVSIYQGDIYVKENDGDTEISGTKWIVQRLANIPLLANRIIESIKDIDDFITPSASILESLEEQPNEIPRKTNNALEELISELDKKNPFETSVIYITSDAGEGKTSLINTAAKLQAKKFKSGSSNWLLVPITLGGRHFLRFDDITVGALQNKYRFPYLYYDSFLLLVKMGVIIPAFDGFEEMFVENSSGEALSAMGILLDALDSDGSVLIAARKAYFEFENLRSQEKLYDTISNNGVDFKKVQLERWNKSNFVTYCSMRGIIDPEDLYNKISTRIGEQHPLLTRPVLVRRLIDISETEISIDNFIEKINLSGANFFYTFVCGIIDREANEKWLDRSGDVYAQLLSTSEHCELLSMIAINMWENRIEYIKKDNLELVTDIFCEMKSKTPSQTQQIRERIRGHALFIHSQLNINSVEFDHDEFRNFFLGLGISNIFNSNSTIINNELLNVFKRGSLPENSYLGLVQHLNGDSNEVKMDAVRRLITVCKLDGQASYTHENCTRLIARLLNKVPHEKLTIENMNFGSDCFRDLKINNVTFSNCYFAPSSFELSEFSDCDFNLCRFGQLKLFKTTIFTNVALNETTIESILIAETNSEIWDPRKCEQYLNEIIQTNNNRTPQSGDFYFADKDEQIVCIEKLIRYFMRSTHISESVIKIKLSDKGQVFIDDYLPSLLEEKILVEIENKGSGNQRRFKLNIPLQKINEVIIRSSGKYSEFISLVRKIK